MTTPTSDTMTAAEQALTDALRDELELILAPVRAAQQAAAPALEAATARYEAAMAALVSAPAPSPLARGRA